ncbi:MAG: UDP-glucose/GDP-mannose dehydrogenase family protein [Gemmatimonadetes bacterium]|nr:UDP-glucose/GDP-mannose dehydrogenase family protein [Gemmatimonadota bacterium]
MASRTRAAVPTGTVLLVITTLGRSMWSPMIRATASTCCRSAELTKYAANAMLATRISFMNQVAELCEKVGADVNLVRKGIGTDSRIGPAFLFPGPGYGGSCFPKDIRALIRTADDYGVPLHVLKAVEAVNLRQRKRLLQTLATALNGNLPSSTIAVWGLSFKARTDDMRESPAIDLINGLLEAGVKVQAHDPAAVDSARRIFGDRIQYFEHAYDAVAGAEALVVVTEWLEFRNPDFARLKTLLKRPIIIDGRNLYDPAKLQTLGFVYHGIGRRSRG